MKHYLILIPLLLAGCSQKENETTSSPKRADNSLQPETLLLTEKPADAPDLLTALDNTQPGEPVLAVGRVGGVLKPVSDELVAFVFTDESVWFCDEGEEDHCPTPWDACCEDPEKLSRSRAFVQFTSPEGLPLEGDLTALTGVKANDTVIVQGVLAEESQPGNPIIQAVGIFPSERDHDVTGGNAGGSH